jgi:hypothetical protein
MTAREASNLYLEFLREEGYRPEIDRDEDIKFKSEGRWHYVIVDRDDPSFVRLVYPNFWSLETAEERRRAVVASERATAETKVAKVYVVKDDVWAAVEAFCVPHEVFKAVIPRGLRALRTAANVFVKNMRESARPTGFVGLA